MAELFYTGGPLFMGILTIILIAMLTTAVFSFYRISGDKQGNLLITLVKEAGLLALVVGVLGQFLELYNAFTMIEQAGTVSQTLLVNGLKVSSITTIYGLLICVAGYLLYFGLRNIESRQISE